MVLLGATNDGLVTVRRAGGVAGSLIVPDLARSLPLVDTAETTYTFVLRPGLRYSTGRPVLASDVRASIERVWRIRRLATPKEPKGGSLLTDNPDLRLGLVGEEQCAALAALAAYQEEGAEGARGIFQEAQKRKTSESLRQEAAGEAEAAQGGYARA